MKFKPTPYKFHTWDNYSTLASIEYIQCLEEGLDVKKYKDLFDAIDKLPSGDIKVGFTENLADLVHELPMREGYEYNEPSELDGIKLLRNLNLVRYARPTVPLEKKILGAWYGRICGCLLGKPIESLWKRTIDEILKSSGNYPLTRYLRLDEIDLDILKKYNAEWVLGRHNFVDEIDCAPFDDDTNYTVMGQCLIDRKGLKFTARDVLDAWVDYQGKNAYCTAERVAYRNYVAGYLPPYTAIVKNPYREWIGAQIRADYYGYITSEPSFAAEMAFRDASISHVKNGIYGEMMVAAMLASAHYCEKEIDVIYNGLAQIPKTSRLYAQAMELIKDYLGGVNKDECFAKIHERYNDEFVHDWCHTIPNALIVIASLLYGEGDFGKSICTAVETGFDTDCNGATVGSIFGMIHGVDAIGEEWKAPLKGKLRTQIFGHDIVDIDSLAKKTLEHNTWVIK